MKKVWILGGGIAGIEAAISLCQEGFSVTVVSNRDFLFIHPISIWIPTGEKSFDDVCLPLSELAVAHGFEYIVDEVVNIRASNNTFMLKDRGEILYEYLIIAVGGERLQHDGIENTYSICGRPDDSIRIKDKVEELIKIGGGKIAAGFAGNPVDVTAVRGEPAFEFIFNIHNMLKKRKLRDKFEFVFFTPASASEHRLGPKIAKELQRFFSKLKIVTKFGENISSFDKNSIFFENGDVVSADMIMFISGRRGPAFLKDSDLPLSDSGFVKINNYCQVEGFENIFAVGDVASLEGPDWRIKQGHLAEIMARNAAFNIFSIENGSDARRSYIEQMNLIFMLDMGDSASLVYKNANVDLLLPMPVVGHWLKKGWGRYYRLSRLGKIPRIPGA
ncbi:MAG: NAD(P)/FAD-dependent oxidoreductase [Campylobacterales bacterium]